MHKVQSAHTLTASGRQTIFITGTNLGFGKATVELFANKGWNVAATVRNKSAYADLFRNFKNVKLYELDVTNFEGVNVFSQAAIRDFN
jgi:NADP-dependent 3-hydroxy acid dehydrogenase YdfG